MSIVWFVLAICWFIIGLSADATDAAVGFCVGGFIFLFLGMMSKDKS